jgi:hypothetical protein
MHYTTAQLRALLATVLALAASLSVLPAPAQAAAPPAPRFTHDAFAAPSVFSEADNARCEGSNLTICDTYQLTVGNAGNAPSDGTPVKIVAALAAGLQPRAITLAWSGSNGDLGKADCNVALAECSFPGVLAPDQTLRMNVYMTVKASSGNLSSSFTSSGGGSPASSQTLKTPLGGIAAFGTTNFAVAITGPNGKPETQAGAHPYEFTTRIDLNSTIHAAANGQTTPTSVQDLKDVVVDLPIGFLGSAEAAPQCTLAQLSAHVEKGVGGCPSDTIVGRLLTSPESSASVNGPLYNMVAEEGRAAEFGFVDLLGGSHVLYGSVVPSPEGYALRTISPDIPQVALTDVLATLYGDPSAKDESGTNPVAMFTNPAFCSGQPLTTTLHIDSWQHPGRFNADGTPDFSDPNWISASSSSPPVSGCESLQFNPEAFSVKSDTTAADSPAGLSFTLGLPHDEQPQTLATPPLRDARVTLPEGFSVNPSSASNLQACSESQIGWLGGSLSNFTPSAPSCPKASKIGTVELSTPLLPGTLQGSVYLAAQNENPFGSLLAGYIVIDDPTTGVVVKIPGELALNQSTGQITGAFDENPQLPFSNLKLRFFGGSQGDLATPENCATYTTNALFTPWSAPDSGLPASLASQTAISSNCSGGFSPTLIAGLTSPHAASYSPFALSLSRNDGEGQLAGASITLPPGLLAKISGVPLCSDEDASRGSCPESSQVATVRALSGPGPNPLSLPGKAFLTGPYNNGPYGLAVTVPAIAGPFNLGNVTVRQSLRIDPYTAQASDVSDPFPTIIDGIPIRLRRIDVNIDRPNFTLNPTSCAPSAITATITSTRGQSAALSSRFQTGGCRELPFKPSFKAATSAKATKANGTSFSVKVGSSPGQANIAKVRVELPKQLPSRLSTLQKACTEAVFAANPASCPADSVVGSATAHTPLLSAPLTGPAYLVSHGNAAFPDLTIVLQGSGITLILVGNTDIKKGVTISTFNSVPDAPIESFALSLPAGPHSALTANANLCASSKKVRRRVMRRVHGRRVRVLRKVTVKRRVSLAMPTLITGQNGAVIKQATKISVAGCPKSAVSKGRHRARKGSAGRKG